MSDENLQEWEEYDARMPDDSPFVGGTRATQRSKSEFRHAPIESLAVLEGPFLLGNTGELASEAEGIAWETAGSPSFGASPQFRTEEAELPTHYSGCGCSRSTGFPVSSETEISINSLSEGLVPIVQRAPIPGWNFTPSDFAQLQGSGKDLTIAPDSSWFPSKLQDNLLNTLRFLFGPKISPRGTEGVNVLDFFHGHLVVDRKDLLLDWQGNERAPEEAMKHAREFEKQEVSAAAKTLGGKVTATKFGPHLSFRGRYPVTATNLPAFTTAIEKLLPAFGNVLEEGTKVPGAAVMYHTFELIGPSDLAAKGQKLNNKDPRRHYVTPLDTNTPRQYTPPSGGSYEMEYLVIAPFSFLLDTNGAVHVRPFEASAGSGFTSLELSTVTGTPFTGEPFPVP
jgi:hypothetical protein